MPSALRSGQRGRRTYLRAEAIYLYRRGCCSLREFEATMGRAPFQVVVLPFRITDCGRAEFAILQRADDQHWQGIAGGGEGDETSVEAARREALEEAGVPPQARFYRLKMQDFVPVSCFTAAGEWSPDTYVVPQYFFACDARGFELTVSREHTAVVWMPYTEAHDRLRYDSNKTGLWELAERLRMNDLPVA